MWHRVKITWSPADGFPYDAAVEGARNKIGPFRYEPLWTKVDFMNDHVDRPVLLRGDGVAVGISTPALTQSQLRDRDLADPNSYDGVKDYMVKLTNPACGSGEGMDDPFYIPSGLVPRVLANGHVCNYSDIINFPLRDGRINIPDDDFNRWNGVDFVKENGLVYVVYKNRTLVFRLPRSRDKNVHPMIQYKGDMYRVVLFYGADYATKCVFEHGRVAAALTFVGP